VDQTRHHRHICSPRKGKLRLPSLRGKKTTRCYPLVVCIGLDHSLFCNQNPAGTHAAESKRTRGEIVGGVDIEEHAAPRGRRPFGREGGRGARSFPLPMCFFFFFFVASHKTQTNTNILVRFLLKPVMLQATIPRAFFLFGVHVFPASGYSAAEWSHSIEDSSFFPFQGFLTHYNDGFDIQCG